MPLSVGDKFGTYEILAPIGKGGMGEVYRARDTKLKRDAAIKVLPGEFARNPERMARFQREAEVLASLNHPNIATIYGVEGSALVMEMVEGESPKGPLSFDEAWKIASQIAGALEYAHDKGIVHRDLKPANIKITPEGVVKLLDFGLAKAFTTQSEAVGGSLADSPTNSPTLTIRPTEAGMILGTAAYMAPEQARGTPVDKRADIWAFGVVLYELLTGERLFQGEDAAETLAAVIHKQPDFSRVPAKAHRLIESCLEKDPKRRLRDIGDARRLVGDNAAVATEGPISRLGLVAWTAAGLFLLTTLGVSFVHFREAAPDERVLRFSVPPPPNTLMGFLAISPDGRRLVAGVFSSGSKGQLLLRSLDSQQFQLLSGTDGARSPFWSADNRFIGFFADGKLKTVPAAGGPAQTLCGETGLGSGGAWNRDGVILFASETGPLRRVGAVGGECAPVTKADQTTRDGFPEFLPDGKHFLYFHQQADDESSRGVYVAALDNPKGRKVLSDNSNALFAPAAAGERNGYLLFLREGNLMAQSFDPDALQSVGDPFLVTGQASPSLTPPGVAASLSSNGVLVYLANRSTDSQLTWFDRSGKELDKTGPRGELRGVSLSPDGNTVAVGRRNQGIWIYDLVRGSETRFAPLGGIAVWSPDSNRIVWSSPLSPGLFMRLASGAGSEESLLKTADRTPASDWSRDGRFLIYTQIDDKANADIWYLPDPGKADSKPVKFLATDALESQGQLSPDGHWIAYVSNETGKLEVYVRPFPSGSGQWKVSVNGGGEPRWNRDGKELFFLERGASETLLAVSIQPDGHGGLKLGTPQKLFGYHGVPIVPQGNAFAYSPHPDGKRFVVAVGAGTAEPAINIVTNWQAGLKK